MSIAELYKNDEYVRSELVEAHRLMGSKTTNLENLIKGLGFLYLYCNEKMRFMAEAALNEATIRKMYVDTMELRGL